jgi:hypothetical protein
MGKSQAITVQLEDPRGQRFGQTRFGTLSDGRFREWYRRVSHRGDGSRDREPRGADVTDARTQKLVQVGRNREFLARGKGGAFAPEFTCKL